MGGIKSIHDSSFYGIWKERQVSQMLSLFFMGNPIMGNPSKLLDYFQILELTFPTIEQGFVG